VEESQRRSNNDLGAKYESHYQQTQLRWSLPSSWMGTPRRATSMARDIIRHGPVAPPPPNGAHASKLLPSMRGFLSTHPPLDNPLTVLDLRTNLPARGCNAQLPTHPPIIGERNCGSYNHCTTSTRFLQLTIMMMMNDSVSSLCLHRPDQQRKAELWENILLARVISSTQVTLVAIVCQLF
ncbi:hypothetical protein T265_14311, partial [Opisthorchis viverrini]